MDWIGEARKVALQSIHQPNTLLVPDPELDGGVTGVLPCRWRVVVGVRNSDQYSGLGLLRKVITDEKRAAFGLTTMAS